MSIQENQRFNGTQMRLEVTDDYVIVSNADGFMPGIYFFDHDWNAIDNFPRTPQAEAPYNLEVVYVPEFKTLQVYIAGTDIISIIE